MSATPEPAANWWTTEKRFTLVGCPDDVTYRGHGFIPEVAVIHTMKYGSYVWIQGRAIRKDGSISRKTTRGKGYGIDIETWTNDSAPQWLLDALQVPGEFDG